MRRRVIRVALAATLVSLVLVAVPLAIGIRISFFADERAELERSALAAAVQVGPDFSANDPVELPRPTTDGQLAVYDRTLTLRAGTGPQQADDSTRAGLAGHVVQGESAGSLVVAVPVASSEQVIGVVRASSPISAVRTRIALAWLAVLGGAVIALLIGITVATWQARRLTTPLESLARISDAVAAGDLSARAEPSGIAEVDALGNAQNAMVERLGRVLDHARHFAADAAHQLRTPLAGLRLTLETGQTDPDADPRRTVDDALRQTGELQRTVQEVLGLSQLRAAEPQGPIGDLFAEAEHRWHGLLAERGRRLIFAIEDQVGHRVVPLANSRQILDVLLDNARTHGHGTVRVTAHDVLETTAIDVRDEGSITADVPDLFRRGGTTQGTGIGLALARNLAESSGGRLVLASSSPTVFRLLLPDQQPDGSDSIQLGQETGDVGQAITAGSATAGPTPRSGSRGAGGRLLGSRRPAGPAC
ncbi:sensor histidine kinase [Kribbella sp.]|uniref:sensor histidine kinase n=1 Tax=Kribbella sp. TaxID=1871183 RepID=UPI002D626439|nr:histidine kinase dimerization/phospho-acceptor domain-containing protein [Kribbella sp.]HZX02658.1 histidine kinase dimerization/phospho-acceptor domain-containing protein [Kribbella sp.]